MNIGEAKKIAGTLSFPSKMPGTSYGLPARACITGAKLATVAGSVCSLCYAMTGGYARTSVATAQGRRLAGILHPLWALAITRLLRHYHSQPYIRVDLGVVGVRRQREGGSRWQKNEPGFHRWHDSGDLQSVQHFAKIVEVCVFTPKIRHWLPTQELAIVKAFIADGGVIPENLTIRVSSPMIDDDARRAWPTTSSVFTKTPPAEVHVCPAPKQEHRCGSCRACWRADVPHVVYALH